jgi:hypothetical protein
VFAGDLDTAASDQTAHSWVECQVYLDGFDNDIPI